MHTTPLLSERDTDLRRAIHAIDPEVVTTVLPAVVEPARDPKRGFVLATVGGVVGLGALVLLVALVLATSNNSTRPAVVSPPLAPVTTTTTAQAVTTTPSAAPSAGVTRRPSTLRRRPLSSRRRKWRRPCLRRTRILRAPGCANCSRACSPDPDY